MTPEFLLTALVIVATPGTGALYTIAAGLARGRAASLVAALGCTIGIVPHAVAAVTGLAAILHASAVAFETIRWLGVAYLVYLAWMTWRDRSDLAASADDPRATRPRSPWQTIRESVLINLLNPKLTIFFFAFLPQFVPAGAADALPRMLLLSVVFMVMTLVVFALYGLLAAALSSRVIARPKLVQWLRRTFAAVYVAMAGRLALESR